MQRLQRATLREAAVARSRLNTATAFSAELRNAEYLPPAAASRSWMWQCKYAVDAACCAADETVLTLKGLLATETSHSARGCLPAALAAAVHAATALRDAKTLLLSKCFTERLPGSSVGLRLVDAQLFPRLVVPSMLNTLTVAFETAAAQRATLQSIAQEVDDVPGWSSMLAALEALSNLHAAHIAQLDAWSAVSRTDAAPESFVAEVDELLAEVLLWAQAVHSPTVDVEREDSASTIAEWMALLEKQLGVTRLHDIGDRFERLCDRLASMSDAADTGVSGAAAALCLSSPPFALVSAAAARLAADYVSLHKSTAKLCGTLASTFCSLARDGFCTPPPETEQGADKGGELQDDKAGTGIGEGEGKKDVSNEIEDEAQVLGMEDMQKNGAAPDVAPDDPAHGLEIGADFEGEMHELEHDPEGDDDDPPETEADQLDKQVRTRSFTLQIDSDQQLQ